MFLSKAGRVIQPAPNVCSGHNDQYDVSLKTGRRDVYPVTLGITQCLGLPLFKAFFSMFMLMIAFMLMPMFRYRNIVTVSR